MKSYYLHIFILILTTCSLTACDKGVAGGRSPDEVYSDCKAIFQKKGDPLGFSEAMCTSMKEACEAEPSGEQCQKANRMIDTE